MTNRVVKLPDIGEGVAEAEVTAWHVKVGDLIREDQPLADVMTDKATVEIPSPVSGTVVALGVEAGQMLAVGGELVRLELPVPADAATSAKAGGDRPEPGVEVAPDVEAAGTVEAGKSASELQPGPDGLEPAQPAPVRGTEERPQTASRTTQGGGASFATLALRAPQDDERGGSQKRAVTRTTPVALGPPRTPGEKPIASPAVRGRAREAGIDLRQVRGTGPAGRITHDDLDAFAQSGGEAATASSASGRIANTAVDEVKVIGMRRRIAQKMAESKRRAAHFSYVDEVDVTALEELRAALNKRWGDTRPKLTLIPFLVAALVKALPDFPQINALYDDDAEIVQRHGGVHVGIATQTPNGLMVPVVRHAEARSVWDVATEVKRLADAARAGLAQREELVGSTITITSLGALGGLVTTPVLNRPEVAIIGVNKQVMRPVWQGEGKSGHFVPRLTMNISASFDHRIVDGYDAALFVQALRSLLETPATLFMEP